MDNQRDRPDDITRGTVQLDERDDTSNSICIRAHSTDNGDPGEITLDHHQSVAFKQFLQNWLRQTTHLYYNPPNKTHLVLSGDTICHYNARGGSPNYPHGILTGRTEATYIDPLGDEEELQLNPTNAFVSIATYSSLLPQLDWCEHCLSKGEQLGLLPAQDTNAIPPGNPHPPCPECGGPLQVYEDYFGAVEIRHTESDAECGLTRRGMGSDIKRSADDDTITAVIEEMLGIDALETIPTPVQPSYQPRAPEELPSDLEVELNHRPEFRQRSSLTVDSKDNSYDPRPQVELDHPTVGSRIALRFADMCDILRSDIPVSDVSDASDVGPSSASNHEQVPQQTPEYDGVEPQPSRTPDRQRLPRFDSLINQIAPRDQTDPSQQSTATPPTDLSESDVRRSLITLPVTDFEDINGGYAPAEVSRQVDTYETADGRVDEDAIDIGAIHSFAGDEKYKSRHYHQRILNPGEALIDEAFTRLDLPSDGHCVIFGGYTGEFARAIGQYGYDITFTDPLEVWVANARSDPHVIRADQVKYSNIPASEFCQADLVASFECYHPLEPAMNNILYNLLRAVHLPHGLVFATAKETIQQMENQHGNIAQFKSRWGSFTSTYQDLSLTYTDVENIRFWHLSAEGTSLQDEQHVQRVIDRQTILELVKLAGAVNEGVSVAKMRYTERSNEEILELARDMDTQINLNDSNMDMLAREHPICSPDSEVIYQSLGRLGQILQSENSIGARLRNDELYIAGLSFILPEQALKYV